MGKRKRKNKKSEGDKSERKGNLQQVQKPSSSGNGRKRKKPLPGCSSGVRTRKQVKAEFFRNIFQPSTIEGSTDTGEPPSGPVPVKIEEGTEVAVKMEERVGTGSSDEHGGILVDIPTVVVKEEVMLDSVIQFEDMWTEEVIEENEAEDKEAIEENIAEDMEEIEDGIEETLEKASMMEGSADTGEPSVPVPVEIEELTEGNVEMMEEGVGNGSNEEHGEGILIDFPPVLVKEEVIKDSEVWMEEDMEENEREIDEETIKKALLKVLPLLEEKDVFKCRLVNKQWRGTVDDFIEYSVAPIPYDDNAYLEKLKRSPRELYPNPKFEILENAYEFEKEMELEKFNEAMEGHVGSPFIGGASVTLMNCFKSSSALSPATKQFLEKFGVYIRHLKIQQRVQGPNPNLMSGPDIIDGIDRFVNCVRKCLHYVPNLESLKLEGNGMFERDQSEFAGWQTNLYKIEFMDRTPKLDKLQVLEFEYFKKYIDENQRWQGMLNYFPYLEEIFGDIMINPYYKTQLKKISMEGGNP